jgi:hypothetical protein
MNTIDSLLTELETLSAKAMEEAAAPDFDVVGQTLRHRAAVIDNLQALLATAEPVSYTEWNRLAVIHFQGNRVHELLEAARQRLAGELMQNVREQALLGCVNGVVNGYSSENHPSRLNEQG